MGKLEYVHVLLDMLQREIIRWRERRERDWGERKVDEGGRSKGVSMGRPQNIIIILESPLESYTPPVSLPSLNPSISLAPCLFMSG